MMNTPAFSTGRFCSPSFLRVLAVVTAAAGLLRLAVCLQLCPMPFVAHPAVVTDMATYRRLALEIAAGDWPTHFYYQPLYYAVFLPVIYTIFGPGPWGPALMQTTLGTATVWLTGLSAARVFGRRAGMLAAILLALSRFQIFYVPFLLIEVLQTFWMSLVTYLAIRFWRTKSNASLASLGLVTAAAVLTRGNAILLVPGVLGLLVWRLRAKPSRALAGATLYLALVYGPQLPFDLRNLGHFGRWTGPSSAQDAVLALGNTPEAPPGGLEYPITYHDWMELANRAEPERVPVSRQVMAWVRAAPLQFIELKTRMALLYWHRREIANNIDIDGEGRFSSILRWPFLLDFSTIGVAAVGGLFLLFRRRSPNRLFLYYTVAACCLGTIVFYVLERFRLSALPVLCVFGGAGIARAWCIFSRARSPAVCRRTQGLLALLAFTSALCLVWTGFPLYQLIAEASAARLIRPVGVQVMTHRRVLLYDHGPYWCGGMRPLSVPATGLVVRKRFALPQGSLPDSTPTLRVPVLLQPGTQFDASVSVGEQSYGTAAMTVEPDAGHQRLTFRMEGLRTAEATREIVLSLRPISGDIAVLVDTLRWYSRSEYATGTTATMPLQAEAAFELEWLRKTPTNH